MLRLLGSRALTSPSLGCSLIIAWTALGKRFVERSNMDLTLARQQVAGRALGTGRPCACPMITRTYTVSCVLTCRSAFIVLCAAVTAGHEKDQY